MNFIKLIVSLTLFSFLFACNSNSDILAKYKDGSISRGDLKNWLELRESPKDKKEHTKEEKESFLKSMYIEREAIKEAKSSKYDKNELFLFKLENARRDLISLEVHKRESEKINISIPYVKGKQIVLNLAKYLDKGKKRFNGKDLKSASEKAMKDGEEIIAQLKKGTDFDSLIKKHADTPDKAVERSVRFWIKGETHPLLETIVMKMKDGEYSDKPIVLPDLGIVCIVMIEDHGDMNGKNIKSIVKRDDIAKYVERLVESKKYQKFITELQKTNLGQYNPYNKKMKGSDIFFTIGEKKYTLSDVKKDFSEYIKKTGYPVFKYAESLSVFARNRYIGGLCIAQSEKSGLPMDAGFKTKIESHEAFALSSDYMRFIGEKGLKVSEREIRADYKKNKNKYMLRSNKANGKPRQLSYREMKPYIQKILLGKHGRVKSAAWSKSLLAKNELKIMSDKI